MPTCCCIGEGSTVYYLSTRFYISRPGKKIQVYTCRDHFHTSKLHKLLKRRMSVNTAYLQVSDRDEG
jgi:hypothetical protein